MAVATGLGVIGLVEPGDGDAAIVAALAFHDRRRDAAAGGASHDPRLVADKTR